MLVDRKQECSDSRTEAESFMVDVDRSAIRFTSEATSIDIDAKDFCSGTEHLADVYLQWTKQRSHHE